MVVLSTLDRAEAHDRHGFLTQYRENRRRSADVFGFVEDAMYERPLARRLPFIFYLGHLPVFSYITLAKAYGLPPIDAAMEELFRRGIDPVSDAEAEALPPVQWPSVDEVRAYAARADAEIERIFQHERLSDDTVPMLVDGEALYTILEHEAMHQETLLYLITCLDDEKKQRPRGAIDTGTVVDAPQEIREIPAGAVVLGAVRGRQPFGWDNEFGTQTVTVERFYVSTHPVTNREYARYVAAGGPKPIHWFWKNGEWQLHTVVGAVPLPLDWPVYVSQRDARMYATRCQARLMTEAEYQHAAYGSPDDTPRRFPWGNALPTNAHANCNFRRLLPEPIGSTPAGTSAWGIAELVGNGWEITGTPFAPLPGFTPMASYPVYSADFFDGDHFVVKGASAVTAIDLVRPSLRNWFFADYPYAFTKFRLAYSRR